MNDAIHLTAREIEVLELLARGRTYTQVGDRLDVSLNTVASHVKSIYRKLEVRSARGAIWRALELGLLGRGDEPAAASRMPDRVFATVLFVDLVSSTERVAAIGDRAWHGLLRSFHASARSVLAAHGGREIDTAGDGYLAAFDLPARAIRGAGVIRDAVRALGIEARCGVHAGECELSGGKLAGIALHIGARIAALASAGEVLVSQTVRDLVAGSGLAFADRGEYRLKGVPGAWRLYATVEPAPALRPRAAEARPALRA